ncbi:MAG: hypothetical protein Q8907_13890, partial [Bacteroidota bacterium]|nr:hypothetical protein [Bacteroidota bacterium]
MGLLGIPLFTNVLCCQSSLFMLFFLYNPVIVDSVWMAIFDSLLMIKLLFTDPVYKASWLYRKRDNVYI